MKLKSLFIAFAAAAVIVACKGENKKRGADYSKFKTEMNFTGDKAAGFEAITSKYDAERKAVRESMGEKPDRVTLFTKFEELQKKQDAEVREILTEDEMNKYNEFVAKNTRKRSRYNDELLAKIQTDAQLDAQQMQVVNAANNAFEKAFSDAHDLYHGNSDLAKEYFEKYDAQRKAAIKNAVTPEQYVKFEETVKDVGYKGRE